MKTIILAAGLGTRVQHLYPNIPKVMLPLAGKPLLERTILRLKDQGFTDILMNLHYFPDVITDHFGDGSKFGVSIRYSYEEELLESAGAIKKMEHLIDSDDFLLLYGDLFWNINARELVALHRERNAFGTILVKNTTNYAQSDFLEIEPVSGRIVKAHVRPHSITATMPDLFANIGFHVWSRGVLEFIPSGVKCHLDREVTPKVIAEGKAIYARPLKEGEVVMDMGKPDNITKVETMFKEGLLS